MYYTVTQASELTGIPRSTLLRAISETQIEIDPVTKKARDGRRANRASRLRARRVGHIWLIAPDSLLRYARYWLATDRRRVELRQLTNAQRSYIRTGHLPQQRNL